MRPVPMPPTRPRCGRLLRSGRWCGRSVIWPGHACTRHRTPRPDLLPILLDLLPREWSEAVVEVGRADGHPRDGRAAALVAEYAAETVAVFGVAEVALPRAGVAEETGLSTSAVRSALRDLCAAGVLLRLPDPPEVIHPAAMFRVLAAVPLLGAVTTT